MIEISLCARAATYPLPPHTHTPVRTRARMLASEIRYEKTTHAISYHKSRMKVYARNTIIIVTAVSRVDFLISGYYAAKPSRRHSIERTADFLRLTRIFVWRLR